MSYISAVLSRFNMLPPGGARDVHPATDLAIRSIAQSMALRTPGKVHPSPHAHRTGAVFYPANFVGECVGNLGTAADLRRRKAVSCEVSLRPTSPGGPGPCFDAEAMSIAVKKVVQGEARRAGHIVEVYHPPASVPEGVALVCRLEFYTQHGVLCGHGDYPLDTKLGPVSVYMCDNADNGWWGVHEVDEIVRFFPRAGMGRATLQRGAPDVFGAPPTGGLLYARYVGPPDITRGDAVDPLDDIMVMCTLKAEPVQCV